MRPKARPSAFAISALVVLFSGACGGSDSYDLAPVSGQVTLDGQPLPGALVNFQPVGGGGTASPGPGSVGRTDEQGRYALETVLGRTGAVVGSHRVRITTIQEDNTSASEDNPAGAPPEEPIPPRYNAASELVFDVPPSGTSSADFPLKSADPR